MASRVLPVPPGPDRVRMRAPCLSSETTSCVSLSLPTKEDAGPRQVGVGDRLQGREAPLAQLVEGERLCEVLQAVGAELGQLSGDEDASRLRHEHLAAVARAHDPGRRVHVHAHVLGRVEPWLARMHPYADRDRPGLQPAHRLRDGCDGLPGQRRRRRRRHRPRSPPRSPSGGRRPPDDAAVLAQGLAILLLAQLFEQPRRALDVGEDERDRAAGLLCHERICVSGVLRTRRGGLAAPSRQVADGTPLNAAGLRSAP